MPNILEDLYYGNISPNERRIRLGARFMYETFVSNKAPMEELTE